MTETVREKQQLLREYLSVKGAELDKRGRAFLEALLQRTAALENMYFTKNAYYIRDRVLVGTSLYYSPRFYFRLGTYNINIENIFPDNKVTKFRSTIITRESVIAKYVKPDHIFPKLEKLPYWFLQIDEDFAELHHIGEGFTTQRILENPDLCKLLKDVHKSVLRKETRRRVLMKHIEKSLVNGDKNLFMRLTQHLKRLSS
jgi:uncharacterized protein YpiB (UPF0302 family)